MGKALRFWLPMGYLFAMTGIAGGFLLYRVWWFGFVWVVANTYCALFAGKVYRALGEGENG